MRKTRKIECSSVNALATVSFHVVKASSGIAGFEAGTNSISLLDLPYARNRGITHENKFLTGGG